MDEQIRQAMARWLEDPTPARYAELTRLVVASPGYQPYGDSLRQANQAYQAGEQEKARAVVSQDMPNLLLSPHAHLLLAMVAQDLGDERAANIERYVWKLCLEGLLATGDGSLERPYRVTRTSDEYAILGALQLKMTSQALMAHGDRHLDRLDCGDGKVVHFDITEAYQTLI